MQWGQGLIQRLWTDKWDKRLPVLVTMLALVLLSHSMAELTWKLVPVPQLGGTGIGGAADPVMAVSPVSGSQPLAGKIASWNIFGKFEVQKANPAPVQQAVETAPDTRLNLKLRGVFSSPNPKLARAIIEDAKGDEDSYAVDDSLPGGAVLNQVFTDKVILEYNGRLETLRLPVDEAQAAGASESGNRSSPRRGSQPGNVARPTFSPSGDTGEMLRQYRDALLNDPQSVMGLVRAEPYQKDGQLQGYRIRPGKDRQLLTRFGLKSGDIVTAVNGVPMNNPIKALEVLRDLSTATELTVNVERRGVPQSFTFSIN